MRHGQDERNNKNNRYRVPPPRRIRKRARAPSGTRDGLAPGRSPPSRVRRVDNDDLRADTALITHTAHRRRFVIRLHVCVYKTLRCSVTNCSKKNPMKEQSLSDRGRLIDGTSYHSSKGQHVAEFVKGKKKDCEAVAKTVRYQNHMCTVVDEIPLRRLAYRLRQYVDVASEAVEFCCCEYHGASVNHRICMWSSAGSRNDRRFVALASAWVLYLYTSIYGIYGQALLSLSEARKGFPLYAGLCQSEPKEMAFDLATRAPTPDIVATRVAVWRLRGGCTETKYVRSSFHLIR
ncbi:hypothetical protein EVAR_6731_1 [Eumeta japonica]|uniref:Uncharacterized protein n=1 Tax=Eumeta variegata TaxID=151549 RepID=A0A4C1V3I9_EUMVA|nr:hypothetical protein EVAR_6731_1 [Eumeta japonica]